MKNKYMVMKDGATTSEVVKVFRKQSDAVEFIANPKNTRVYGSIYLMQHADDGKTYTWDEYHKEWKEGA